MISQRGADFLSEPPSKDAVFGALAYFDGSEQIHEDGSRMPALERHRLIYESRRVMERAIDAPSLYKVFEFVAGAQIVGRAAPGARVRLSLPVRTNRDREFVYTAERVADRAGRYAFRVPYANRGGPRGARPADAYRLSCGGETAELVIGEEMVRGGGRLVGPDLCLPAPPGAREE